VPGNGLGVTNGAGVDPSELQPIDPAAAALTGTPRPAAPRDPSSVRSTRRSQ
jgi:hypothetical protein